MRRDQITTRSCIHVLRVWKKGASMKIGLIDVDGHNFPNVPLMKISSYHKALGDDVEWWFPLAHYDRVYKTKIFSFTPDINTAIQADEVIEGGTGYAIKLEDGKERYDKIKDSDLPAEIEKMCPDYSLYPQYSEAYGFLTRGCPRGCPFCVVAKKEGRCSKQVAELSDFYRGQKEIKLLDPNILACVDRERMLIALAQSGAKIDFTQGLDIRLTEGIETLIKKIKIKRIHFAWDNPKEDLSSFFESFKKITNYDRSRLGVYVLTNFNSTMEENLYRVYKLRELGYDPYIMIYDKEHAPQEIRYLQRWVNNKIIFRSTSKFEEFDPKRG